MKVLLTQDVPGLGTAGEVKEVALGYARNYLIPKGLAVAATPGTLRMVQAQQKAQKEREARLAERVAELSERMATLTLTFQAKAGPTGRLYGSVTTADIAEALERELGVRFDRRKIASSPLREVGEHTILVRLSRDVEVQVPVVVQAEGAEEPSEETAESAD
ncbi:MAG TPA: 50S ribosomal protein L9 [Anaerolineales bacterium]|nr:50S ribosomal protein L9 [Anaerolineae bacterium]HIQ01929.1 50S ribosomal protein L9 [Anaerolineales bacterium]